MKTLSWKPSKFIAALGFALASFPTLPSHAERSPIFGAATIEAISSEASRDIIARGDWANYYGSVATSYAYNAYVYSYYARYFSVSNSYQEQSWYATASWYSYYAYVYSGYAQYYSSVGM